MNSSEISQYKIATRIASMALIAIILCDLLPLLFAIRHLDRILLHPQTPGAVFAAVCIAAAYIAYSTRVPGIRRMMGTFGWITIPSVICAATAAIVEEWLFRQVLMNWLSSVGTGAIIQVGASAIAFGALHAVFGIGAGWRVMRGAIVATTLLGLALGTLYLASGRVLVPCIEAHFIIDLVLEPALFLFAAKCALERRASRHSQKATT